MSNSGTGVSWLAMPRSTEGLIYQVQLDEPWLLWSSKAVKADQDFFPSRYARLQASMHRFCSAPS